MCEKCSKQFTTECVTSVRASCTELPNSELDVAIFGQLMATVNTSSTVLIAARHEEDAHKGVHFFLSSSKVGVCSTVSVSSLGGDQATEELLGC